VIVYYFLRRFGFRPPASCCLAILFGLLPQVLVYENTFYYSHLEATLLLGAMFFSARYLSGRRLANFVGLSACLVALALTRSFFHISWIAVVLLTIWGMSSYRAGRDWRALVVGVAALGMVSAVYFKNLKEFGIFAASSWQGIGSVVMLMCPC
jgi:hypothetical protein